MVVVKDVNIITSYIQRIVCVLWVAPLSVGKMHPPFLCS